MKKSFSDMVHRLGGDLQAGGARAVVPGPGHSKCDRSLSLLLAGDRIIYHSFAGDPDEAVRAHLGLTDTPPVSVAERRRAQEEQESQQRAANERAWKFCERVWNGAQRIEGTPAEAYLRWRGIDITPADARFHPAAPTSYEGRTTRPALVVLLRDPGGAPTAIQATFIKPDGKGKALADRSRLTFGPLRGGAVRLAPSQAGVLGIAEGTETALSFMQLYGIPTWAALGTSNLAAFLPPAGVRELYIAADPGPGGQEAARRLANRMGNALAGALYTPEHGAGDWNDVLLRRKELF